MHIERECCAYVIKARRNSRDSELVQSDWDYPGTASRFGWSTLRVQKRGGRTVNLARLRSDWRGRPDFCEHSGTDGTVDCRECGCTAGDFIRFAGEFLDKASE